MSKPVYSDGFYKQNVKSSTPSSERVLGLLSEVYTFDSVVDFGCGSGAWLVGAESVGAKELVGFDGPWADPARFTSDNIQFTAYDFENELPTVDHKFDLAISVEVAEHLYQDRVDPFFDALCATADVIVFSAAIPYQGGTHHVNEQPQSYWIERFAARDFEVFDIFRARIWNDDDVRWWFRQNIFLFVRKGSEAIDRDTLRGLEQPLRDVVHPVNFVRKIRLNKEKIRDLETQVESLQKSLADAGIAPSGDSKPNQAKPSATTRIAATPTAKDVARRFKAAPRRAYRYAKRVRKQPTS